LLVLDKMLRWLMTGLTSSLSTVVMPRSGTLEQEEAERLKSDS